MNESETLEYKIDTIIDLLKKQIKAIEELITALRNRNNKTW